MQYRGLLLLLLAGMSQAVWFEEDVYKDSKRVVQEDDSVSSQQRNGLLSVLLHLDQLYNGPLLGDSKDDTEPMDHQRRKPSSPVSKEDFVVDEESASLLKSVLEGLKSSPSKRGRYDVSGALPPLAELCRVMHMKGCSHSRHK